MLYDLYNRGIPEAGIPGTTRLSKELIPGIIGRVIEYVKYNALDNDVDIGQEHEGGVGKDLRKLLMQATNELTRNYGKCWGNPAAEFDAYFPPLRRISEMVKIGRDYDRVKRAMRIVSQCYQEQTEINEFVRRNI